MGMENNYIEKFDPSKLMEGVKDRIKSTFVSLIPDNLWETMVEREIYIFTTGKIIHHHETDYSKDENGNYIYQDWDERIPYTGRETKDSYGRVAGEDISPLQKMVREMLNEAFRKQIADYIRGEDFQTVWNSEGKPEVSRFVEDVLVRNSDIILKNMVGGMIQSVVDQIRYQVPNQP